MKTVTPVISVILLVLLTIVAGVSAYFFINSNVLELESQSNLDNSPLTDNSRLNLVSITGTKAIVRNDGTSPVTEVVMFVNGELLNYSLDEPILPGELKEVNFTTQSAGEDLEIRVVYNKGKTVANTSPASKNTINSGFCSTECSLDSECNDSNPLTLDSCATLGACKVCSNLFFLCIDDDTHCPAGCYSDIDTDCLIACGNNYCEAGENPYNCQTDCEQVDVIYFGSDYHEFTFNNFSYSVYDNGWNERVNHLNNMENVYFVTLAYDSNNEPVATLPHTLFGGGSGYYNYSYSFFDSGVFPAFSEKEIHNGAMSTSIFAIPSADYFKDNNAIFVVSKRFDEFEGNISLAYFMGNKTGVSEIKEIFSGNYSYAEVDIDFRDIAHIFIGEYSEDSSKILHSIYNRTNDSWSEPELVFETYSKIGLFNFKFDHSGNGLILFSNSSFESGFMDVNYSYAYFNGSYFSDYGNYVYYNTDINNCENFALGFDNEKWIIRYFEEFEEVCVEYLRTYNGSLSAAVLLSNTSEITPKVISTPFYYNKQGSNVYVNYGINLSSSYFNSYAKFWNGTAFVNSSMLEENIEEGSCPFIYSYDGTDYYFEHEAYNFALFKDMEYETYEVLRHLRPVNDKLILRLSEELDETSYTNNLKLYKVEHSPYVEVMPDLKGNIRTMNKWVYPNYCSKGCLSLASKKDGHGYSTDINEIKGEVSDYYEELIFEFKKPEGVVQPKVFLSLKETGLLSQSMYLFMKLIGYNNVMQLYNGLNPLLKIFLPFFTDDFLNLDVSYYDGSRWVSAGKINVGAEKFSDVLVSLGEVSTDNLLIRLKFLKYSYIIDELKADYSIDDNVKITKLRLLTAKKGGMNYENDLFENDQFYAELGKGESIDLTFEDSACKAGKSCSYISSIKGYYETNLPLGRYYSADLFDLGIIKRVYYYMNNFNNDSFKLMYKHYFNESVEFLNFD